MFYDQIQGFDHEPGYVYKLRVNTTKLPRKDVPADASNLKHELVEVLEKTLAEFSPIEGNWKVVSIRNAESKTVSKASPFMTLSQGRVSGSDGCNTYFSSYKEDGISINFLLLVLPKWRAWARDCKIYPRHSSRLLKLPRVSN